MSRRAAIGVNNGNWRRAMRNEVDEIIEASIERIRDQNKDQFRVTLSKLKFWDSDGWESWYDDDKYVPNFIVWTDSEMVKGIVGRMEARISEVKGNG